MNTVESVSIADTKCAAGVVLSDGSVVRLADEPPAYAPTVKMTGNGQR